ncbi:protein tyrosine phosphatase [Pontibacillus halophilus JSM 076056 = DSM 19796]|uniref:Protein tyrosine phosphatase n=1 Tax=Pontibacillus halophilus JSM 076056 = DSM 19796 TaxID=1385510 RepID=A0A0A5GRK6_9BACI|nr:low molecular weight protein arginine phosphatase [Pontibacillus halophilus]KGX93878.1 protein tyrosine phosphatase [Pontibacillus halophilus JSM 076056 = DSM 19796]
MKNVLFVCTGNTCRSPMAEAVLKAKDDRYNVQSAGLFAQTNGKATPQSEQALDKKGYAINHSSQPLEEGLIQWADLVLTMTARHKESVIMHFPEHEAKVYTLKEYALYDKASSWDRLTEAYATMEDKKAVFMQKNKDKYNSQAELEMALYQHLNEEIELIREIERNLPTLDINDPFGGNQSVYDSTLEEIEKHIELLIQKVDNNRG